MFTFPPGTGFDNAVVPPCHATDMEAEVQGEAACPPASRVLHGMGTTASGFGGEDSPFDVTGWDDGSGLLLLGEAKQFGIRSATRARREGNVVTVEVPKSPGGPPDGESSFRKVHNVLEERSLGARAYTRTPPVCPRSGVWTFRAEFTFADGVVEKDVSRMPCKRGPALHVKGVPRARCVSRGFRVRVRAVGASRVVVRLDGRVLRKTTAAAFAVRVRARRLRAGRHRLTVVARDASGSTARRTARFTRC